MLVLRLACGTTKSFRTIFCFSPRFVPAPLVYMLHKLQCFILRPLQFLCSYALLLNTLPIIKECILYFLLDVFLTFRGFHEV